jgi:hypothetical protein
VKRALLSLLAAAGTSLSAAAAPGPADLESLSAAARPVVATRAGLTVAVVFPAENTAQLLVFRAATLEASSAPFEFPLVANYGAAWVEIIDIPTTSRFTLHMRTRQTCGPGLYDYRFAQRRDMWLVSGLDRAESECSEAGIVPSWKASYDFLTGAIVRTDVDRKAHVKVTKARHAFPAFPLTSFEAFASRYEAE